MYFSVWLCCVSCINPFSQRWLFARETKWNVENIFSDVFRFPRHSMVHFFLLRVLSHVHTNVKLAFLLPFNFRCSRCDPTLSIFLSGFVFTPFTFISFDLRCNCICDCCLHLSLFRRLIHANSRPRSFSVASRQLSYCVRNFFLKKHHYH